MTKDEYDFYLFIFFYEDKRKDKTPSGISFPRAFPKPEKWGWVWVYTLLLSHTESCFWSSTYEYGDRENV